MQYTVTLDETNRVVSLSAIDAPKAGDIVMEGPLPDPPEHGEAETAALYVKDGRFVYRIEPCEPPPAPDPGTAEDPAPTREAVREARQAAYRERVDPLTAEISRLRDMAPSDPRIAEAEAEREVAVASIVAEYPYPSEEA